MQALLRLMGGAIVIVGLLAQPSATQAQARPDDEVTAGFKGTVGLGLVGAELGAVIPAIIGLEATWAYLVFPAVGAAGGAVAGYFLLDDPNRVEASVIALTAGMALIIPALVTTLALTAYSPGDDAQDNAGSVVRLSPSDRRRAQRARAAQRKASAGAGLLRLSEGELALSAPGLALVPGPRAISGMSMALVSGHF